MKKKTTLMTVKVYHCLAYMVEESSSVKSVLSPESPTANTRSGAHTKRALVIDKEIRKRGK